MLSDLCVQNYACIISEIISTYRTLWEKMNGETQRNSFYSSIISLTILWKVAMFEINPSGSEMYLRPSRHICAYDWHFLDLYIASPNSPNRRYNLHLAAHPPPPTIPPPLHPPPYTYQLWYYSGFEKSFSKSSNVSYLAEIVTKRNCPSYTAYRGKVWQGEVWRIWWIIRDLPN